MGVVVQVFGFLCCDELGVGAFVAYVVLWFSKYF